MTIKDDYKLLEINAYFFFFFFSRDKQYNVAADVSMTHLNPKFLGCISCFKASSEKGVILGVFLRIFH